METCIRGFSFMPENPEEMINMHLRYVENIELERTWKATRRERMKQQEQMIWDEFVKEQDILQSVCNDDPYQFLNQLPEPCIQELLDDELQRIKNEQVQDEQPESNPNPVESPQEEENTQHTVVFADVTDEENEMFHIYKEEEKEEDVSGAETAEAAEVLNDSIGSPPVTVRERCTQEKELTPLSAVWDSGVSGKSSENVVGMIESSIYCAKIKDLRIKITEEIQSTITSIECQNLANIDPNDMKKLKKRSTEYCARFSRIRMYQLQRQLQDISRHNSTSLPFPLHTQFQSQMVRLASLYQNVLQAVQIFHKSLESSPWLQESVQVALALVGLCRDSDAASRATVDRHDAPAAKDLYTDELLELCEKMEATLKNYNNQLSNIFNTGDNASVALSKRSKGSKNKSSLKTPKSTNEADTRLSMYSLDTHRAKMPKSVSSKGNQSSVTSKNVGKSLELAGKTSSPPKSNRHTPRSRRPLMRAPKHSHEARRHPPRGDADIQTMVEAVVACSPSHISREESPQPSLRYCSPRHRSREQTPRDRVPYPSPKAKNKRGSPSRCPTKQLIKIALSSIASETNNTEDQSSPVMVSPLKIVTKPKSVVGKKIEVKGKTDDKTEKVQKLKLKDSTLRKKDLPNIKKDIDNNLLSATSASPKEKAVEMKSPKQVVEKCEKPSTNTSNTPRSDRDKAKTSEKREGSPRCEVSALLRLLCKGDTAGNKTERVSGAKNAQLFSINSGSPRQQPSTSQLLRILEETIQKKTPRPHYFVKPTSKELDRLRLTFSIPQNAADHMFRYRTQFVQHMLSSSMYANCAVGKPWEMICDISEKIIDDILLGCAKEMEIEKIVKQMYQSETK